MPDQFWKQLHYLVFWPGLLEGYYLSTHLPTPAACLYFSHLGGRKKWYLFVFLICIYLMFNDVEYLFMRLLTIYRSSLENWLSKFFAHFSKIGLSFYRGTARIFKKHILCVSFLSDIWFTNTPILWTVFSVSWWCALKHKSLILTKSNISIFPMGPCDSDVTSNNPLTNRK